MKKLLTLSLVAVIAILLFSCGGGGTQKHSIVGKWKIFEKNGEAMTDEFSQATIFNFKDNGEIGIEMAGMEMGQFKYTTEAATGFTKITIVAEQDKIPGAFSFEDNGNILILKTNDTGDNYPTNMNIETGFTVEKYKKQQ
ncbi:MAG TPA: hypothetical protein ENN73_00555 [Firmicutes bacterium]|nr:hypothetical protein [Bacillota bacterium]